MFQVKIDDNANLKLIWLHHHFQQNVKVPLCQKYWCWTPKMCYQYTVIRFVCGSSTGTHSPEKCCQYTVNKFVCSLSTVVNTGTLSSKNLIPVYIPSSNLFVVAVNVWFEKTLQILLFFSIFYIKNESLDISGDSK